LEQIKAGKEGYTQRPPCVILHGTILLRIESVPYWKKKKKSLGADWRMWKGYTFRMVFQKAFKIEIKLINLTPREPHKFDELLTFFSGEEFEAKEA